MDADDPPDAAALATRLLADDEAPDPGCVGEAARALAWALKDGCYGAWSTNPALATRAAGHLARLRVVVFDRGELISEVLLNHILHVLGEIR